MRRARISFIFGFLAAFFLSAVVSAQNVVTPTWHFQDYSQNAFGLKTVIITPLSKLSNNTNTGVNFLVIGDPRRGSTTNSSFTTNLLNGSYYRVEFWSGYDLYAFTNFFDTNVVGAVDGGDPLYRAFSTNQDRGIYAYSAQASLALFLQKIFSPAIGYVATATDTHGGYDWEPSQGGSGGGISLAQLTNGINGSTGVIGTNGALRGTTFIFSPTGTNAISAIALAAQPATVTTNNGTLSGVLKGDGARGVVAATAGTDFLAPNGNGSALTSLSAANLTGTVPDASLAANIARTNNVNGTLRTNAFGIVDCYTNGGAPAWAVPNGSLGHQGNGQLWLMTNNTWTAINITGTGSGGSGTVTSVGLTVPPVLSVSGTPITGSGTLAVTATVNFETNNGAISSGAILKSTGGSGASAATAGTDYVAPATTITVAGTANQITSSAGAQDLSANRTWTLSFPNVLILPGTLNVAGNVTNQGTVSTTGNSTNFGGNYNLGGVFSFGVPVLNGASNLNAANLVGTLPYPAVPAYVETNAGAIASGSLIKSTGANGVQAATAGTDYIVPGNLDSATNYAGVSNVTFTAGQVLRDSGHTNSFGAEVYTNSPGVDFVFTPVLTNQIYGTNLVVSTTTLSPTANATNYTLNLKPPPDNGTVTIYGAATNIFLTLTGTNFADWGRTLFVNNYTSAVNCNLAFNFTFATNLNFTATVSNGFAAYFNFHNPDTTGTNVSVNDSGRLHH